ncbi:MAG: DNA-directed RNA polymerase subunit K [Nitrososphaera sp.]|uniref:DNA-directed RNA polymerase subunit K n=1 Tax=Candidatus Nitrososphaera gargensis TaxID=497727 RepID=UPI001E5F0EF2|nr:DNA-directed RNA polymerase subunit K [Candidatus Nitrososphaera gargensis]
MKHSSKKSAAPKKPATTAKAKTKKASAPRPLKKNKKGAASRKQVQELIASKKSSRPADEVVTYPEVEYELKEIEPQGNKVLIGPPWLTRFERARITGSRSLQLSLGAPPLIKVPEQAKSSIMLAVEEIDAKALPISIRRILPNGVYQDIPIDWMK